MYQYATQNRIGASVREKATFLLWKLLLVAIIAGSSRFSSAATSGLDRWLLEENRLATTYLLGNVSPPGSLPGAIIASPSRSNPDYYYHWVRDSGIALKAINLLYASSHSPLEKQRYLGILMSFVDFSRLIQWTATHDGIGLGEARFTVRGEHVPGQWGDPQDDGPAIRAIELVHFAFILIGEGREDLVRKTLYDGKLPTDSVIKTDLEYLSHHWRETCFGPWEDERGHHFYTQLLERKALAEGALLALRLGDNGAANWYLDQVKPLGEELKRYWDPVRHYLVDTRDWKSGVDYKVTNLDSSVIVAALGCYSVDDLRVENLYPVNNEQILATVVALEKEFQSLYPINSAGRNIPGIAIGRYPEDRYDGNLTDSLGNPWPSLTLAFAMYYYKLAIRLSEVGEIEVTPFSLPFFERLPLKGIPIAPHSVLKKGDSRFAPILVALREKGDSFLERVRYHANPDGTLSEEMNRFTGFQQGAPNLTMNYAAFLLTTALRARLFGGGT